MSSDDQPLRFWCPGCRRYSGVIDEPRRVEILVGRPAIGGDVVCSACRQPITTFVVESSMSGV